jgi:S1-C subfamily serine protease
LGIQVSNIEKIRQEEPKKANELAKKQGIVVEDFSDRSPAKAAGIEKGDVIKAINDVAVHNFAELQNQLARYRPGDKVKVTIDRNGTQKTYTVELKNTQGDTKITRASDSMQMLGATFKEISDAKKDQLGISSGVEVASVTNNGLFRKNGINKGFIIMRINNIPVNSQSDIERIVANVNASSQDKVLLIAGFYPNERTQYIAIDLSNKQ